MRDMHSCIATQSLEYCRQGAPLGKALEVSLGLSRLESPQGQRNLFAVIVERQILRFFDAFSDLVPGGFENILIAYDLRDVDELGKQRVYVLRNEKLELFCREAAERLCQSVKGRRVISPVAGKGLHDAQGFREDSPGFGAAEFALQRIPVIDSLEGKREIEGRIHQEILCYADLPLVSINHAEISTLE